jgi:hypothetical protein
VDCQITDIHAKVESNLIAKEIMLLKLLNRYRFSLSAITAHWYFHRNEPSTGVAPWKGALIRASTTSFGTLAFGSLILAIIQFLQFIARTIRKVKVVKMKQTVY